MEYTIIPIDRIPEMTRKAASWFAGKWEIPEKLYFESITASFDCKSVLPRWYLVLDGDDIIGGAGVIDNDFHERKDMAPNVCAVYVEEEYRNRGIAGKLLDFICTDMALRGIRTLYLITDWDSFYERYGWEFIGTIKDDDGEDVRLYRHRQ